MANRFIEGVGAAAGEAATELARLKAETVGVGAILYDKFDGVLKYYDRVNSVVRQLAGNNPAPVSITGSVSLTNALHSGRTLLLNAVAGGTITLPVASGSGDRYFLYIGTSLTSASWIIDVPGSDKYYGGVLVNDTGGSAAATSDYFPASGGSSVHLTLAFSVGAGVIGDFVEIVDVGALKWAVNGVLTGEADPTTPWS